MDRFTDERLDEAMPTFDAGRILCSVLTTLAAQDKYETIIGWSLAIGRQQQNQNILAICSMMTTTLQTRGASAATTCYSSLAHSHNSATAKTQL